MNNKLLTHLRFTLSYLLILGIAFDAPVAKGVADKSIEVRSLATCSGGRLKLDAVSGAKDTCVSKLKKTESTRCKKVSRKLIKQIVKSKNPGLNSHSVKKIVEYLYLRSYRMKKNHIRGRDYCSVGIDNRKIKALIN